MSEFFHWDRDAMSSYETTITRIRPTLIAADAPSIVSEIPAAADAVMPVVASVTPPASATIVEARDLDILKHSARTNSKRRARFCAHPSPDAEHHDMLIVSLLVSYVTPH